MCIFGLAVSVDFHTSLLSIFLKFRFHLDAIQIIFRFSLIFTTVKIFISYSPSTGASIHQYNALTNLPL